MSETSVCLSLHRSASLFNKSFPNSSSGAPSAVFLFAVIVAGTTIFGIFLCFFGSVVQEDAAAVSVSARCCRCRGSGRFAGAVTSLNLVGTGLTTIGARGTFLMMSFGTLGTFAGLASVGCGTGESSFLFSMMSSESATGLGAGTGTGSGSLTGSGILTGSGTTTGSGTVTGTDSGSGSGSGSGTGWGMITGSGTGSAGEEVPTGSGSGTVTGSRMSSMVSGSVVVVGLVGASVKTMSSGGVMGSGNAMGSVNLPGSGIEMGSGNASGSGNVRGSEEMGIGSSIIGSLGSIGRCPGIVAVAAAAAATIGHAVGTIAAGSVNIGSIDAAAANVVGMSTVGMKGRGSGGGFCNNGKKCSCGGSTKDAAGGAFAAAAARSASSSSVTSDPMIRTRVSQGDSPGGILANVVSFARITTTLSSETLAGVRDVTRGRDTLAYVMVDHALGAGNRTPPAARLPLQNIIVRASKNAKQHDAAK
ncbi:m117.1 protein [Murid betaherpesvirus 1]|uniref:M117.1 protein n=1 Tax=Murid herpesvirus 1 TaxID=10366 RepID=H2A2E2_MUHV1|nr:m117.1 protein [Murid betaherpesvirus 1]